MKKSMRRVKRMRRFNFILFGLVLESSPVQRIRSPFLFRVFDILNPLRTPQFGTAGSRISLPLLLRRWYRFFGEDTHLTLFLQCSEGLLDHPIFEGVKRDDA